MSINIRLLLFLKWNTILKKVHLFLKILFVIIKAQREKITRLKLCKKN